MPLFDNNQMAELDQLMLEGEFKQALEMVNKRDNRVIFSESERIDLEIFRSRILLNMGNFTDTIRSIDSILTTNNVEPLQKIDALLLKLNLKSKFDKRRECLNLIDLIESTLSILKDVKRTESIRRTANLFLGKASLSSAKGDFDFALECVQKSLTIFKDLKDQAGIADSFFQIGKIYDHSGRVNNASEYYQKCLDIREQLEDRSGVGEALNMKARMVVAIGRDYEKALEYFNKALRIQQPIGNKFQIIQTLGNLGWIHRLQGEFTTALEYLQQMLMLSKEIDHLFEIINCQFQIGVIYGLQGEIDQALEYLAPALSARLRFLNEEGIHVGYGTAWNYNRLGKLYREKEDYPQAKNCFQECLTICGPESTPTNKLVESEARFYLVSINLEENAPDYAQKNLDHLEQLSNLDLNLPLISQRFHIAQAMVMKASKRLKEKIKTQDILIKFLKEECSDHDLVVTATIILCELLLDELRLSGNPEVLNEVKELITHLLSIAKAQPSYWLLAEVYVFQSRLALLDLDLKKAEDFLEQALLLAEEKRLNKLAIKIFSEKNNFKDQVIQWEHLIARNAPLDERLNLIQLESLLERMAYKKLEISEEETLNYAQRAKQITQAWDEG